MSMCTRHTHTASHVSDAPGVGNDQNYPSDKPNKPGVGNQGRSSSSYLSADDWLEYHVCLLLLAEMSG